MAIRRNATIGVGPPAHKRAMAVGGSLKIVNLQDDVREVFEITGLIDVLDVA